MSELVKAPAELTTALTAEKLAEFVNKPLRQVPAEWRPVVWDFWSEWEHLLPTQLALASRLRHWIAEIGLTLDDAKKAFQRVNRPERMAEIRFASDLLAAIAGEVNQIVKDRKKKECERERQEQWKREEEHATGARKIHEFLNNIGKGGS